ncbi:CU044_5270 family protein [Nonomuraea rhodomycinica]|uniref:CU044_5270 family protein n=1 Tax=Nonomuraea rhodomycinica TaxID=1712872 RepID=A0A7Y6MFT4_9ACTN|nr:CU044_5270 family protein [Nonomuraea rhodomycinica]NUW45139.1 CU044_5270 family protein [Nonomuraea rhodomycinica]
MDELRQLRDRHDAMPDPAAEVVSEARSRLAAHMRASRTRGPARFAAVRRARPVWGLGLAGAATAVVLVATTVNGTEPDGGRAGVVSAAPRTGATPTGAPSPTTLRLRPVADARDLAGNAAAQAAAEPDVEPRPGQWAYLKSLSARTQVDGGPGLFGTPKVRTTRESWRRLDEKGFAFLEHGRLKVLKESEYEVTYPYLLSLPDDPGALLERVYEQIDTEEAARRQDGPAEGGHRFTPAPLTRDERHMYAFQYIAQGMRDAVLPARIRAAMYGALARIPGVRYEKGASDLAGRPGVTLYRVGSGYLRDEIFIDPETYAYLGYRTVVVRDHEDHGSTVRKGQILGWDAQLKGAIVDKAGARP